MGKKGTNKKTLCASCGIKKPDFERIKKKRCEICRKNPAKFSATENELVKRFCQQCVKKHAKSTQEEKACDFLRNYPKNKTVAADQVYEQYLKSLYVTDKPLSKKYLGTCAMTHFGLKSKPYRNGKEICRVYTF